MAAEHDYYYNSSYLGSRVDISEAYRGQRNDGEINPVVKLIFVIFVLMLF